MNGFSTNGGVKSPSTFFSVGENIGFSFPALGFLFKALNMRPCGVLNFMPVYPKIFILY